MNKFIETWNKFVANRKLFISVSVAVFLVICAVVAALILCDSEEEKKPDVPGVTETEPVPTETQPEPEPTAPLFTSELTGLGVSEEEASLRPIAVMICNDIGGIPQSGISEADVIFEYPTEGGTTRLMCIFPTVKELPTLGTVRSCRDYYIDAAMMFDALYVHLGASPEAYSQLKSRDIDSMDGITQDYTRSFWNEDGYHLEYAHRINGEGLEKGLSYLGYSFEHDSDYERLLKFSDEKYELGGLPATYVKCPFSSYITPWYEYNAEDNRYYRFEYGEKHIDKNNDKQLAFENIVLLYIDQEEVSGDAKGRLSIEFTGAGKGYYFFGGQYVPINWTRSSRDDQVKLFRQDGEELLLNTGRTMFEMYPSDENRIYASKVVIE